MDFWKMRAAAAAAGETEWGWRVELWSGRADQPPQRHERRFRTEAMAFLEANGSTFMGTIYAPDGSVIVRRLPPSHDKKCISTCAAGLIREASRSLGAGL